MMVSVAAHRVSLLLRGQHVALAVISIVVFEGVPGLYWPAFAMSEEMTPTQEVQGTVSELRHILHEFQDRRQIRERRRDIEQVVRRHADYEQMAKRSLGNGWMELSDGQRDEFVGLFVQVIRDALANRICEYSDKEIRYLSELRERQFASVAARLLGHKADMSIDFRLARQDGRWLLYDAVIDGVSIVSNYRAQFSAIVREMSYAGLISQMKQRTLLVKLFEKGSCRAVADG